MKNSTQTTANKVTVHTAMVNGAKIKNCKNKTFAEAQRLEQINYTRQFGMGDKRNWAND